MAVFEETADAIWGSVSSASEKGTLVEAFDHLVTSSRMIAARFPGHSAFLASLPLEARFHPEFEKLMERRAEFQEETLQSLPSLRTRTGELPELTEPELKELVSQLEASRQL